MSVRKRKFQPAFRAIGLIAAFSAARQLRQFRKKLDQCRRVQNDLLLRIMRADKESDFGRRHDFAKIRSYADFIKAVPPARYEYYAPYIDRCREGQTNALFGPGRRLLMFAMTSGTTAPAKYIPVTTEFATAYRRGWNIWGVKALSDHPRGYLRKILQVTSPLTQPHGKTGVPCGAISGMLARDQKYIVRKFYAAPSALSEIQDPIERYYAIMRFAIAEDVAFISTANPSTTLKLAQTADENAQRIIRNIHDGTLDNIQTLSAAGREQIVRKLRPNPARARELEELLAQHGRLLPEHYWDLAFLANWTGGTLSIYLPRLKEYYGDVPVRDIGLLASEGRMSIPLQDGTPAGVLDLTGNFYEFVPEEQINEIELTGTTKPCPAQLPFDLTFLQADELEIDGRYFIFLSNWAGLYRYHIGDLIRVTDYVGTTPVIEFLSKGAHASSITGEKLTEHQVVNAVNAAIEDNADSAGTKIDIKTFIMAPVWDDPPYYMLHFEADKRFNTDELERLALSTDMMLHSGNIEYESKRESNRLGRLRVRQAEQGALTRRDQELIRANQGRSEQFKHRYLFNQPLEFVNPKHRAED